MVVTSAVTVHVDPKGINIPAQRGNESCITLVVENTSTRGAMQLPSHAERQTYIEDIQWRIENEGDPDGSLQQEIVAILNDMDEDQ